MYPTKIELNNCKVLPDLKEFMKSSGVRLIIFGETHGMIDELPVQKEILKNTSPEFYLYELLEETTVDDDNEKEFLGKPDEKDFSIISKFGELKPTIRLVRKFNLSVIGCDVKNMFREDKSFREKIDLTEEEIRLEEEIMEKREMQQKKVIEDYLSKSAGPVFASLGLYHIRKDSFLIKNLKENFLIVYPVTEKGEKLWEIEDFDPEKISYVVTSRDNYLED